jgi:hypothetical protein
MVDSDQRTVEMDARLRTCADCGMVCDRAAEFHPFMFCVLKKAGYDPWLYFSDAVRLLGLGPLPARPPLVRDLPLAKER